MAAALPGFALEKQSGEQQRKSTPKNGIGTALIASVCRGEVKQCSTLEKRKEGENMENEGEFIERRLDEIFDEKPKKPEPPKIRHAVCARCGEAFETTRPSAKLCRSCLSAARRANGLKAGLAKRRAAPEPEAAPQEDAAPERAPEAIPEKAEPVPAAPEALPEKGKVLTLGLLRRLLDEVDDSAVVFVEDHPVSVFFVEHSYDLEAGEDALRVVFGF